LNYHKSQALGNDAEIKAHVAALMKIKREEVTTFIIIQAQVEEVHFYLILSLGTSFYQERCYMDC
jgi:hypothetical protein